MILEIKGLTKQFGGLVALQDLDMEIQQDEILGLIGPNGSGKTTLLNVITGFLRPTAGSIMYKGQSIAGLKPHAIAERQIVRTFQLTSLFANLTVEENVIGGRHLRTRSSIWGSFFHTRDYRNEELKLKQKADEILDLVGLKERRDILANNLSLGEQRGLEIAVALAAEPELLLLDEPATGVNPVEAARLMSLIQLIQQTGITIMIVEHNMRVIMRLCTRIAVLDYGVKIAEGTPEEIANNDRVTSAYLGGSRHAKG